jgi:hypothetical protein
MEELQREHFVQERAAVLRIGAAHDGIKVQQSAAQRD